MYSSGIRNYVKSNNSVFGALAMTSQRFFFVEFGRAAGRASGGVLPPSGGPRERRLLRFPSRF